MERNREWLRKIFYERRVEFETPEIEEPGANLLREGLRHYLEEEVKDGDRVLWMLHEMERRVAWGPDTEVLEIGSSPYFVTAAILESFECRLMSVGGEHGVLGHERGEPVVQGTYRLTLGDRSWRIPTYNLNVELTPLPFPDRRFHAVVCNEVLEHLHYLPTWMLTEIYRVLRPGGCLFLTTPNGASYPKIIEMLSGRSFFLPFNELGPYGRHSREYTFEELGDMLTGVGFRLEILASFDPGSRFPNGWRRWLYGLLKRLPGSRRRKLREHLFAVATRGEEEGKEYYPAYLINGDPELIRKRFFRPPGPAE